LTLAVVAIGPGNAKARGNIYKIPSSPIEK
jgi:hypothetical protein